MYIISVILNIAAWVCMLAINMTAISMPINGITMQEVSNRYATLFTPANFTFSIWSVIYVLLFLFSLYQIYSLFRKKDLKKTVAPFGLWYVLSCVLNVAWIFLWTYNQIGFSVIVMLLLLVNLIIIYTALHKENLEPFTKTQLFFVRVPFSVYLGWISVATIANIASFLVSINWRPWGWGNTHEAWAILMIVVAMVLAIISLLKRSDFAYAAVIVWADIGIIVQRQNADIPVMKVIITAWVAIGFIVLLAILILIKRIGASQMVKKNPSVVKDKES